jgi:7-cyano-7-deazaguanine synthase
VTRPSPGTRGSVVLLSGGMDSATTLAIARDRSAWADALTFRYGQRHTKEVPCARRLARHFRARRHHVIQLPIGHLLDSALVDPARPLPGLRRKKGIPSTYVPARNTVFLAIALGYAESVGAGSIYLGINAVDYSGYPDCRPAYLRAFRRLAALATREAVESGQSVEILAPLLHLSKAGIVRRGERLGVPWELTWSCYSGGSRPCGRCDACRLRRAGFDAAGVLDPLRRGAPASG